MAWCLFVQVVATALWCVVLEWRPMLNGGKVEEMILKKKLNQTNCCLSVVCVLLCGVCEYLPVEAVCLLVELFVVNFPPFSARPVESAGFFFVVFGLTKFGFVV